MNREIKFRAWDNDSRMFIPYLVFTNGSKYACQEKWQDGSTESYIPEQVTLMQYTGLKDKNGKEIYEGDIIKSEVDALGVVKWRYFGFEQDMINTLGWWVIQEDGEVIGNIYENPELLKG